MPDPGRRGVLVIGIGNELRRDDGAGIAVARRLAAAGVPDGVEVREEHGEPLDLIDRLATLDAALLVDAMRSGAAPGTVRRFDVSNAPLPCALKRAGSTHAIALGDAIEIARALDRLPRRVVVYAVEGQRFEPGSGLSDAVAIAVPAVAREVLTEATATVVSTHAPDRFAEPAGRCSGRVPKLGADSVGSGTPEGGADPRPDERDERRGTASGCRSSRPTTAL